MASEEGKTWWKANGVSVRCSFDLDPGSRSSQAFDAYLKEKGITAKGWFAYLRGANMGENLFEGPGYELDAETRAKLDRAYKKRGIDGPNENAQALTDDDEAILDRVYAGLAKAGKASD